MRKIVETLVGELTRLKAAGVKTVAVSDDAMASLRRVVAARVRAQGGGTVRVAAPTSTVAVPAAPSPIQAGRSVEEPPLVLPEPSAKPRAAKAEPEAAPLRLPPPPEVRLPEGDKAARWAWLNDVVLHDRVCLENVRPGKKVVLGVGSLEAAIFFVGEAPGAEEELRGEPFVGPAGQLLTRMIGAMGLSRETVYIGNIMNWRPPLPTAPGAEQRGNREPTEEEMAYCLPYLRAQLAIVQPRIVVALGATATRGLLGKAAFKTLGEVRGRWHDLQGIPLMVSYHPSYLLRKEAESKLSERKAKRAAWEDLLKVMERAGMPISDKQRAYFL